MLSILLHLYYPESVKTVLPQISPELLEGNKLYVNIVNSAPFDESAFDGYKNLTLLRSSNIGKDVGGKLALIDSLMQLNDDSKFWVFLHDKKSPHTTTGQFWRDSLFSIVDARNRDEILGKFSNNNVNAVTHRLFVMNEWNKEKSRFNTINHDILMQLMDRYDIRPESYDFAAGTMFWARSAPLKAFFKKHNPLGIRSSLERGNVLDHHTGTHAHSWERLLSWIAVDNNKKIAGIG
jgi:lipopolysaccharide biosynthesis protein